GTPQNEFQEEVENRIKVADQRMSQGKTKGSVTDRGRIAVIFGLPTRAQRKQPDPTLATARSSSGTTADRPQGTSVGSEQVWIYEGEIAQKEFGQNKVELLFADESNSGEFKLVKPGFNLSQVQEKLIRGYITSPSLTMADVDKANAGAMSNAPAAP